MRLSQEITKLEAIVREGSDKVFSMYLNTDPSDPDQQGGKWKIHLKNGLHNFEKYLKESDNKLELKNFQKVKEKVERYVFDNEQHLKRGIVVFATADEEVWFAELLQIRLKSEFFWDNTPQLDQLMELREKYPRSGIILVHHDSVHVLETHLNLSKDLKGYELDLDSENWKEKVGPRKAFHSSGLGSRNAQVEGYKNRFEANRHRWFNSIAPKLDKLAKDEEWKRVYVMGEADIAHELEKAMNKKVDQVFHKNMNDQEEAKIIEMIYG